MAINGTFADFYFRTILDSVGTMVIATDTNGLIRYLNPATERLTGCSQAEAVGSRIEEVFQIVMEKTRLPAQIPVDDVLATGNVHRMVSPTVLIGRDGNEYPIAYVAEPMRDGEGQVVGAALVLQDISKERRAERSWQKNNLDLEEQVALGTDALLKEQRRLRFGNMVLESIAMESPIFETMKLIERFLSEEGSATSYGIFVVDSSSDVLKPVLNRNLPQEIVEAVNCSTNEKRNVNDNGILQLLLTGQNYMVEDLKEIGLASSDFIHSCWVEPILSCNGKLMGGLVAFYGKNKTRDEEEAAILTCANRLAQFCIKHAQHRASLEASEERHRALVEQFPAPVFVYDRQTLNYLAVSDRAVNEYGYSREEFFQLTVADIRPAEDVPAFLKMVREAGTDFEHRGLWRHRKKDGSVIYVEITTHGLELNGRPACIVLAQDVTEKIQAENSFRRSEALNLAILQSSLDCIVTMNSSGEIVEFNRAAERIFGYSRSEAIGRLVRDLIIPPEHREEHDTGFARFLASGEHRIICKRIQTTALRSDGTIFPVELTVVPVLLDGERLFTAFLRDQTEILRSQQELHRTSELLQAIADGTTDAIFAKDEKGRYLFFNRAASELTGHKVEEVLGKDDFFLFGEESGKIVTENDQRVMRTNEPEIVEEDLSAAGTCRSYHAMKAPMRDRDGKVIGTIGISRDITQQKKMELALRERELRYRSMVERSPDVIFINRNDQITYVNQAGVELLGADSAHAIIGRSPYEIFHPTDHPLVRKRINELQLEPGIVPIVEERLITFDGRIIDVEVQASSYFSDGDLEIQVVCRDISARKKADLEMRRHAQRTEFSAAIGMELSKLSTLHQMLQNCAEMMVKQLNLAFVRVWIVNERLNKLELWGNAGFCEQLDFLLVESAFTKRIVEKIATKDHAITVETISDDRFIELREWAKSNEVASFGGFPLIVDGRCHGVIGVFSRDTIDAQLRDCLVNAANGIAQNIERKNASAKLIEFNKTLEHRVVQRTLELKASEQFNKATLDALSAHVAVVDKDGNIVATNAAWRRFATDNGADPQHVSEGSNYIAICEKAANSGNADARLVASALRDVLSGKSTEWNHEYFCTTLRGKFWFNCQVTLGYIHQKPHAVVAHEDITRIKLAQEELRAASERALQASQHKSDFLATMSHELRTPLNGVLGMIQLLLTTDLNDRQREFALTCRTSGQLLLELINDILDLSKIEAGKLELDPHECDLSGVIQGVVDMLYPTARQKGLNLSCNLADSTRKNCMIDDNRLRQVLVNLVSNAIKFTPSGEITITAELQEYPDATSRLRVQVQDTGIGIPLDRQQHLFKTFSQVDSSTTRRFGGSGLGLSICRQLIQLMGGEIGVESQTGVGSNFWFEIPIIVTRIVAIESGETKPFPKRPDRVLLASNSTNLLDQGFSGAIEEKNGSQKDSQHLAPLDGSTNISGHILVAEDNRINQMYIQELLKHFGCTSDIAINGEEAIAASQKKYYDLVLMDCQMPGMDGFTATREIRKLQVSGAIQENLPIIALTANALKGDRERCLDAGMDEYLNKPVALDRLGLLLKKYLGQPKDR